ncbi:nicotinate-nucleotide pyrophosphorylase [Cucumis melo var. makuwa]|uniref:Nicotinate-nucleotide pyrophosphorylase n=1 Tax=Cucumis melo var. makuwa TaxID=1194695 RepID=A0A5D3DZY8_CUCMM|nr:nicotinate-nucleotide pyrophosphorylase [Cucumis melo var. makuwa]
MVSKVLTMTNLATGKGTMLHDWFVSIASSSAFMALCHSWDITASWWGLCGGTGLSILLRHSCFIDVTVFSHMFIVHRLFIFRIIRFSITIFRVLSLIGVVLVRRVEVEINVVCESGEFKLRCIVRSHLLDCFAILGLYEFEELWYDGDDIRFESEDEDPSAMSGIINNGLSRRWSIRWYHKDALFSVTAQMDGKHVAFVIALTESKLKANRSRAWLNISEKFFRTTYVRVDAPGSIIQGISMYFIASVNRYSKGNGWSIDSRRERTDGSLLFFLKKKGKGSSDRWNGWKMRGAFFRWKRSLRSSQILLVESTRRILAEIGLDTEFKTQEMTMLLFLIHEGRRSSFGRGRVIWVDVSLIWISRVLRAIGSLGVLIGHGDFVCGMVGRGNGSKEEIKVRQLFLEISPGAYNPGAYKLNAYGYKEKVETRTLEEVHEVLRYATQNKTSLTRMMLDNMVVPLPSGDVDVSMLKEAVDIINGRFETEVMFICNIVCSTKFG